MENIKYNSIQELIEVLPMYKGIHIECNLEQSKQIRKYVQTIDKQIAYLLHTDKGYERESIRNYLTFFHSLFCTEQKLEIVLKKFNLENIQKKKICFLNADECMRVQLARISMQKAELYFIEEPLLNLKEKNLKAVLSWFQNRFEQGASFITTNSSIRYSLLLPGTSFFIDKENYCKIEEDIEDDIIQEEEITILKISSKIGNTTLLFEPKEIDFIESQNKCNYMHVRSELFPAQQTMDELEQILEKSGFFRCHRSYIVNMQKVKKIEKITKNSYTLLLDNKEHSQIPLSKARIKRMKEIFHW